MAKNMPLAIPQTQEQSQSVPQKLKPMLPESSYQQNLSQPIQPEKWYKGDYPTSLEVYGRIGSIYQQDQQKALDLLKDFRQLQGTSGSRYFNPYVQATNSAVYSIGQYGIDASNIDDDFYNNNRYLQQYYLMNGTTNSPSKPGKGASAANYAAYDFYQISKAREDTEQAKRETKALQEEIRYKATATDRNWTDDEIANGIDWKKYPMLAKMNESLKTGEGIIEFNEAIGYSPDAIYGWIWNARNGRDDDNETALINYAIGAGNQYQENPELRAKLDWRSEDYSPYSVGSTLEEERVYFNAPKFDRKWCLDNRDEIYASGDATKIKMYENVADAVEFTERANTQRDLLYKEIDRLARDYATRPDDLVNILKEDKRFKDLFAMDETMTPGLKETTLIGTSDAIDYRWQDAEKYLRDQCSSIANHKILKESAGFATSDTEKVVTKQQNKLLLDAGGTIESYGDDAIRKAYNTGRDVQFQETVDNLTQKEFEPEEATGRSYDALNAQTVQEYPGAIRTINDYNNLQDDIARKEEQLKKAQWWITHYEATERLASGVSAYQAAALDALRNGEDGKYIRQFLSSNDENDLYRGYRAIFGAAYPDEEGGDFDAAWGKQFGTRQGTLNEFLEKHPDLEQYRDYFLNGTPEVRSEEVERLTDEEMKLYEGYKTDAERLENEIAEGKAQLEAGKADYDKAIQTQNSLYSDYAQAQLLFGNNTGPDLIRGYELFDEVRRGWTKYPWQSYSMYDSAKTAWEDATAKGDTEALSKLASPDKLLKFAIEDLNNANEALAYLPDMLEHPEKYGLEGASKEEMQNAQQYVRVMKKKKADALDYLCVSQPDFKGKADAGRTASRDDFSDLTRSNIYFLQAGDNTNIADLTGNKNFMGQFYTSANRDNSGNNYEERLRSVLKAMKPEEKDLYFYYLSELGEDAANEYLTRKVNDTNGDVMHRIAEQKVQEAYNAAANPGGNTGEKEQILARLSPEDREEYDYRLRVLGEKAADDFLENHRTDTAGALESIGRWIGSFGTNLAGGLEDMGTHASYGFQMKAAELAEALGIQENNIPEDWYNYDPNGIDFSTSDVTDAVREGFTDFITRDMSEGNAKAFRQILNGATSAMDSYLNAILVGEIFSAAKAIPFIGKASAWFEKVTEGSHGVLAKFGAKATEDWIHAWPMAINAANKATREAIGNGANPDQQDKIWMSTFLAESVTEAITVGNINSMWERGEAGAVKGFFRDFVFNGIEEMVGEGINEWWESNADTIIMGELSKRSQRIAELEAQNIPTSIATQMADEEISRNIAMAAVTGFFSSGVSQTISYFTGSAKGTVNDILSDKARYSEIESRLTESLVRDGYSKEEATKEAKKQTNKIRNEERGKFDSVEDERNYYANQNVKSGFGFQNGNVAAASPEVQARWNTEKQYKKDKALLFEAQGADDATHASANMSAVLRQGGDIYAATAAAQGIVNDMTGGNSRTASRTIGGILDNALNDAKGAKANIIWAANTKGTANAVLGEIAQKVANGRQVTQDDVLNLQAAVKADQTGAQASAHQAAFDSAVKESRIANTAINLTATNPEVVAKMETVMQKKDAVEEARNGLKRAKEQLLDAQNKSMTGAENLKALASNINTDATEEERNASRAARQRARLELIRNAESAMQIARQNVQQSEEALEAAQRDYQETSQKTMAEVRQQAAEIVDQQIAQEQQAAVQRAQEQAVQEAAERHERTIADQRSGKLEEDSDRAKLQRLAEQRGLAGEQAENFVNELVQFARDFRTGNIDMSKQLTESDGWRMMGALSRRFGVNVVIEEMQGKENGKFDPNTNTITLSNKLPAGQILVEFALHELTHSLEKTGAYKQYHDTVLSMLYPSEAELAKAIGDITVSYAEDGKTLTPEQAKRELVAEFTRTKLNNMDIINRMVDEGLGGRIRNALHNINQYLKNMMGHMSPEQRQQAEYLRRAERMFIKAIQERENNNAKNGSTVENEGQISYNIGGVNAYGGEGQRNVGGNLQQGDNAGGLALAPGSVVGRGSDVYAEQGTGKEATGYNAERSDILRPELGRVSERLLTQETRKILADKGATDLNLQEETDKQRFSSALDEAKASNSHGAYVDSQSVDALEEKGAIMIRSADGYAGAAVGTVGNEAGNIFAVFKNAEMSKARGASASLIIQAIAQGGNKLDCYHGNLSRMYSAVGMIPVARVEFNEAFMPDGWNVERDDHPDIVFWMSSGDSAETVAQKYKLDESEGGYHIYTNEEIAALPLFEDAKREDGSDYYAYDQAWDYRDQMLAERDGEASSAVEFSIGEGELTDAQKQQALEEADVDYMDAVARGDMESAQEDVDFYARQNGYTLETFHGTGEYFNIFKRGAEGIHLGNREQAEQIAEDRYQRRSKTSDYKWGDIKDSVQNMSLEQRESLVKDAYLEQDYFEDGQSVPPFDGDLNNADAVREYADNIYKRHSEAVKNNPNFAHDADDTTVRMLTFDRRTGTRVMRLYAKINNPFVINRDILQWTPMRIADMLLGRDKSVLDKHRSDDEIFKAVGMTGMVGLTDFDSSIVEFNDQQKAALNRIARGVESNETGWDVISEVLDQLGYDGIKYLNKYEGDRNSYSYIALRQSDVKSADAVTYDDNGNVIPLSERFNDQNNDIRYSVGGGMTTADMEHALLEAGVITRDEMNNYRNGAGLPLEGRNPFATSSAPGPQRQFNIGMLQDSDEINRVAKFLTAEQAGRGVDTNVDQMTRAIKWIVSNRQTSNSNGLYESLQKIISNNFDYRSADGQARMVALMGLAAANDDTLTQSVLTEAYGRQGTDLGRALQARKLFRLMTPDGRKSVLFNMLNNASEEIAKRTGRNPNLKFSQWVLNAAEAATSEGDFDKVLKAATQELAEQIPANWKEKLVAWRMLSMLGNFRTHIRNVLGNAVFMPTVGLKNKMAALGELTLPKAQRTKTLGLANPEARAFAKKYADTIKDTLTGEAKYKEGTRIQREKKYWGQKDGIVSKTLGKGTQWLYDANGKVLELEDWIFLKRHFRNAMAGYMTARGLTEADMKGKVLEEAAQYAINEAQKATYRDENKLASSLSNIKDPRLQFVVNAVLPFKKTPANILKRGLEYSPFGLFKSLTYDAFQVKKYMDYQHKKLDTLPTNAISPSQWIDKVCSGLSGSAISAVGALLASLGAVRVGFGGDDDEFDKLRGEQPYSVNFELFGHDVSFTLDWATPVCMPFFAGAAVYDTVENFADSEGKDVNVLGVISSLLGITEPVWNLSMLDGVNSLLQTASYSDENPMEQIGLKLLANYIGSFVPTLSGQAARTIDTTRRKNYVPSGSDTVTKIFGGLREQMENKIPFLSKTNIPHRNVWGEEEISAPLEAALENFLSPGYWNAVDRDDPMMNELERLYNSAKGDNRKAALPKEASKTLTQTKANGDETIRLNAEQYDQLVVERGQTAKNLLTDLFNTPEYQMADDETKADIVSDAWTYANQHANGIVSEGTTNKDAWVKNAEGGDPVDAIIDRAIERNKSAYADGYRKELNAAIIDGDVETANTCVAALKEAGSTESSIKSTLTKYYKPIYIEAYKQNDEEGAMIMATIRETLRRLELDKPYDYETINGWLKNADTEEEEEEDTGYDTRWLNR